VYSFGAYTTVGSNSSNNNQRAALIDHCHIKLIPQSCPPIITSSLPLPLRAIAASPTAPSCLLPIHYTLTFLPYTFRNSDSNFWFPIPSLNFKPQFSKSRYRISLQAQNFKISILNFHLAPKIQNLDFQFPHRTQNF
jgi:hypothetical protein